MVLNGFHLRCVLVLVFISYSAVSADSSAAASATAGASLAPDPLNGYKIVCIYNHKKFYKGFSVNLIDPDICTHINYEFANLDQKTYEMIPGDKAVDIDYKMYEDAVGLKKRNPNLKVILSLGGWEDSTKKYSDLISVGLRMDNFINKSIEFLKKHGFDGLDVAWEYPNCWKGAIGIHKADKENFPEFLEKLRKRFDKENLILSVSVASIKREIEAAYIGSAVSNAVHFINVMTYDMHGPWEKMTGHHTQFDKMEGDKDPFCNVKEAIEVWLRIGADRRKLNVGVATYGKTFTLADPKKFGLNAPTVGAGRPGNYTQTSGYLCYYEICKLLGSGTWTQGEHKDVGFYAYSGDQWASYDGPMSVVSKAKWIVNENLGGVLIKDMSCDDYGGICSKSMQYPLTKIIRMEIIHRIKINSSAANKKP